MATTVTVKGQVTLPKHVRDAAGIHPGDRVDVRLDPSGGVVIERVPARVEAARRRVEAAMAELDRQGVRPSATTDEVMRLLRSED